MPVLVLMLVDAPEARGRATRLAPRILLTADGRTARVAVRLMNTSSAADTVRSMTRRPRHHVFIVCEGESGASRPKLASLLAPRWGPRVRIAVDPLIGEGGNLFVLHRTGHGDLVVLAGSAPAPLEEARLRLGRAADFYAIAQVPVVRGPIEASEAPRRQRRFTHGG